MSGLKISELPILSDIDKADVMPIVDISANVTKKVSIGDIVNITFANISPYTYIIDSNQKLADWANNVAGNDYTNILIKKGTYSFTFSSTSALQYKPKINLTDTGTKTITGEAGSQIDIIVTGSYDVYAMGYTALPENDVYFIKGLNLTFTRSGANSHAKALQYIRNLSNCNIIAVTTASNGVGHPIDFCYNVVNCTASGSGGINGLGISGCTNVVNCKATGIKTSTNTISPNGTGIYNCVNVVNCVGIGEVTVSSSTMSGSGFRLCKNVSNCTGTGTAAGSTKGYGFDNCTGIHNCKAGGHCTTAVFFESSANQGDYNSTYAAANTPNGGWNDTTNPSE